jgi:DNA-binding MarR family transcriptional regulator
MPDPTDAGQVAGELRTSISLLVRRLRQAPIPGELTLPERAALTRLERGGPATSAALARVERISPQSMGTTLAALEARGLVERRRDPGDGRRVILSLTPGGLQAVRDRRSARTEQLAHALAAGFSEREVEQLRAAAPLLERLAQTI